MLAEANRNRCEYPLCRTVSSIGSDVLSGNGGMDGLDRVHPMNATDPHPLAVAR